MRHASKKRTKELLPRLADGGVTPPVELRNVLLAFLLKARKFEKMSEFQDSPLPGEPEFLGIPHHKFSKLNAPFVDLDRRNGKAAGKTSTDNGRHFGSPFFMTT